MICINTLIVRLRETMSQEEIALAVGAHQTALSRWERGQVPASAGKVLKLIELAKSKGIEIPEAKGGAVSVASR